MPTRAASSRAPWAARPWRCMPRTAATPRSNALALFEPDAVLLDVDMPGMDGFATCAALMDRHADLPVIFMTGLGETGHIVRGFEVGACDYVTKPVAIAEVVARVRSHAAKARLARTRARPCWAARWRCWPPIPLAS
ncbi:response regulator transcription factor [Cupriavidus basilensis]